MKPITHTVVAWLPSHCYLTPEDIATQKPGIASQLCYTTAPDLDMGEHGYTRVGTAEITLHLIDRDALTANKIDALRAEKKKVQAEATMRATEIDGQIQNLLAITHQPADDDSLIVDASFDADTP